MRSIFLLLLVLMLAACSSGAVETLSDNVIQTAIAQTQAAQPSSTLEPPPTLMPEYTTTPIPSQTPTKEIFTVKYEVTSPIKAWDYVCMHKSPCDLMQITWNIKGSTNSCTFNPWSNLTDCVELPIYIEFNAYEGDMLSILLDIRDNDMRAECTIAVNGEIVSRGQIEGLGKARCETVVSQK
jgi:hypothetical protein